MIQEFLTSRSRNAVARACPRARWIQSECLSGPGNPGGVELIKQAVPLVTGVSVHAGLAASLNGLSEEESVQATLKSYNEMVTGRGLEVDLLEPESYIYQEQCALAEALTRLGRRKVIPQLLSTYEILGVEVLDKRVLYQEDLECGACGGKGSVIFWLSAQESEIVTCLSCGGDGIGDGFRIWWRSITDALMRKKDDGQLYLLSWKTCAELPRDDASRIDVQGVSESWAIEERLQGIYKNLKLYERIPETLLEKAIQDFVDAGQIPKIRGIQMAYLVKGTRRDASKENSAMELTPEQISSGWKLKKTGSPLIYGYVDTKSSLMPPPISWTKDYNCVPGIPHAMNKSSYYPKGECPGDGRHHVRGKEWVSFPAWRQPGGVKAWMDLLESGLDSQAGDPLNFNWALPVPNYRTKDQMDHWFKQTKSQEKKIVEDIIKLRPLESAMLMEPDDEGVRWDFENALDESSLGVQDTNKCNWWFGRNCPSINICWGPEHVKRDPLGSGLYQIKTQYKVEEEVVEG